MKRLLAITLGVALAGLGTTALASRNSSGSYTVTASGTYPFVTGTVINSTTMNSIFSDLSTETTDSLSRSGKGPMLAPLKLTNGSVTAPAMTFNLETGTGFYRIGASDIALSIGGVKKVEFTSGLDTFTDPVSFLGSTTTAGIARFPGHIAGSTTFDDAVTFVSTITVAAVDPAVWTTLTPGSGWTGTIQYAKQFGFVYLRGSVLAGGGGASNLLATLPAGFRPSTNRVFPVAQSTSGSPAATPILEMKVTSAGSIALFGGAGGGANNDVWLDGIVFAAED